MKIHLSALGLLCAMSFPAAAQMAPSGSFGFLLHSSVSDPATNNGTGVLGVMNFDGAGNVTGTLTLAVSATATQPSATLPGTFAGTYSTKADGTGTMNLNVDLVAFQPTFAFAMVITDGGHGLLLSVTGCGGMCDLGGDVISGAARLASPGPLKGSYGYQLDSTPNPRSSLGTINLDGAGNASVALTQIDVPPSGAQPPVQSGTVTGIYTLNPDGTGIVDLISSGSGTVQFVVTDGGSQVLLLTIGGKGGRIQYGIGQLQ
jgi:hypothetical protein